MKDNKNPKSIAFEILSNNKNSFKVINHRTEIKKSINNSRFQWITTEEVIEIYEAIAKELNSVPLIIHTQLISDALYYPIRDIIFYNSNQDIFARICNCVYYIGHTVNTCNVPLMVSLFVSLCRCNNIEMPDITIELYNIFDKAYSKVIHPDAFERMLHELIITKKL